MSKIAIINLIVLVTVNKDMFQFSGLFSILFSDATRKNKKEHYDKKAAEKIMKNSKVHSDVEVLHSKPVFVILVIEDFFTPP